MSAKVLEGWTIPWLLGSAALGSLAVVFVALEARRIYERAAALEALYRAMNQNESLINGARDDRDRAQQQVVVSRRDGGKGEKRARHPRDFRPWNLIERLQDVHHLGEH